jgi:sulfur-carrier protein
MHSTTQSTVTVMLPAALLTRTGSRATVTTAGATIREVIDALDRQFPGFRFNLCHETGELRPFVNIFLNGENIRYRQGLETPVPDGARLHVLPSVAGG